MMFVDDPARFLSDDLWLAVIGNAHIAFWENSFAGGKGRCVLFDGALDVGFGLFPKSAAYVLKDELAGMLGRGCRVLVDKIGLQDSLPPPAAIAKHTLLTEQEFVNTTHDFWYHAVWAAKKLGRGEWWTARYCVDTYMKGKLLAIIECHARAVHGPQYDTWHNGRFIEEWAESWILEKLSACFSRYDREDIKSALLSTMALFRSVAVEAAEKFGFQYPKAADAYATAWVAALLGPNT
jgi:aminoglycoside 6-adenylyltransferase